MPWFKLYDLNTIRTASVFAIEIWWRRLSITGKRIGLPAFIEPETHPRPPSCDLVPILDACVSYFSAHIPSLLSTQINLTKKPIQMTSSTSVRWWVLFLLAFNYASGLDDSTIPTDSPLNKAVNLKAFAELLIKTHSLSSKHENQPLELAELTALWSRLLSNSSSSSHSADSLSLETCHKIEGPSSPVCQFASKVIRHCKTLLYSLF